jgi:hypothetical protein
MTDFALRFHVYGRIFHLPQLARIMGFGDRCHHYGAYKAHRCGLKDLVRNRCYQWLRGAYFVIKAFSWRGVAQTMEDSSRLFLALHRREFVRQVHSNVLADSMNDEIAGNLQSYCWQAELSQRSVRQFTPMVGVILTTMRLSQSGRIGIGSTSGRF